MAKAKYDPLEAAKIGADGEKAKDPPPTFKAQDIDVSDVAEVELPPAKTVKVVRAPLYRVLETCRLSIDSQICIFTKDAVIDSAGYGGESGIEKLISQGLKLAQVQ